MDAPGVRQVEAGLQAGFYARQYGEGAMTLARAAQEAGVSLWEMMDYVRQRKVTAQYDLPDLQHDLAAVLDESSATRDQGAE